jgi:pyruvate/2-oxoglutarate dehydrogenase complex dihydrolipoamide dehydrogenase (E3) component
MPSPASRESAARRPVVPLNTVLVEDPTRGDQVKISGRYIIIATGTTPARPAGVEFDVSRKSQHYSTGQVI